MYFYCASIKTNKKISKKKKKAKIHRNDRERNNLTIIVGDFSTSLSIVDGITK